MDGAEQLMMAALDDELAGPDRETLRVALVRDPLLCERWVALVRQERQLRQWCLPGDGAALARGVLAEIERERAAAGRIMAEVRLVAPARGPVLRLVRYGALAAGVVLAVGLGWLALRPPHPLLAPAASSAAALRLIEVSGAITVARLGQLRVSGAELASGDRITIGAGGAATLSGDRGATRLTLKEGTSLRLLDDAHGPQLALDAGMMAAVVAPQAPDRPLLIATPHAELRVVGTRFSLAVAGSTTLTVGDGVVAVRRTGETSEAMVGAGATFDSAVLGAGIARSTVWQRDAQWERIATAGTAAPTGVVSQAVAPGGDPAFHPDQLICLQSGIKDGGEGGDQLFLAPHAMTIELHLRAERAGTVMVVLAPFQATPNNALHAGSKAIPVGPSWSTIAIAGDALSSHAFPHGLPFGTKVWAISLFGFAAGRLEIDRIVVRGVVVATP